MSQPAFDFGDEALDDASNPTFTVAELADAINDQLRRGFRDGVWVRGEISDMSTRGPHTYFSLVEHGDAGKAVLNVQLFAPMKRNLTPILRRHRLELRNGMKVRIFGHLDFWATAGRLGLKMAGLDPRYTLGDIAQTRDEVVRRLVAEGLLDANRRHRLSAVPLRIGVVTSVGTAAWHDFRHELESSGFGFHLHVVDTRVQGEMAENMITAAIARLSMRRDLDAIVLIRGGGARNELAVFDAEQIARMIAAAPVPVLTGLGHEVDRSVADEVAHTALKTPTACAGELIGSVARYATEAEQAFSAITQRSAATLSEADTALSEIAHRIVRRTHAAVERSDERLQLRITQLSRNGAAVLDRAGERLDRAAARLVERPVALLRQSADRLDVTEARIRALDPALQLARGWSITRTASGAVVRSIHDVAPGDTVVTALFDGSVTSVVDDVVATPAPSAAAPPPTQKD